MGLKALLIACSLLMVEIIEILSLVNKKISDAIT